MKEIFHRTSVRNYQEKQVEEEKITMLLKAAMAAPSAGNQQPWEFIVVENPAALKDLSKASPYAGCVAKAPMAIVALGDKNRFRFEENWQMDLSAAVENILLEADHLGLGAVWLGIAPLSERMEAVSELFHLSDNLIPFAVIPCGYPVTEVQQQKRYDEARIHYIK
ncbi:MAG: nitroreductase family protein [Lachnospiraceae bacterium]|nr:nitroreductase family protein [Lachnospiraceae bacterium]